MTLSIEQGRYSNNRKALILLEEGEPYADITVNLVNAPCGYNQAYIDVNNLNDALYQALKNQKVISKEPINRQRSGYIKYPLHEILIK